MNVKVYINKEVGDAVQLLMTRAEFQELENGIHHAPMKAFLDVPAAAQMIHGVITAGDALREKRSMDEEVVFDGSRAKG